MLIGIAVGWYVWRRHVTSPEPRPAAPVAAVVSGSGSGSAAKPRAVRRITEDERHHLDEQIVAARAVRESHAAAAASAAAGSSAGAGSSEHVDTEVDATDDHTHDLDRLDPVMLDALNASIPFLASCYEQQAPEQASPGKTAVAQMTLTNDPDIGAVIDADQIQDDQGKPLDPKVDACLRSTLQTLELPPLHAGSTVKMQYSFKFDAAPAK
jgi:hypothetical protein